MVPAVPVPCSGSELAVARGCRPGVTANAVPCTSAPAAIARCAPQPEAVSRSALIGGLSCPHAHHLPRPAPSRFAPPRPLCVRKCLDAAALACLDGKSQLL